MIPPGTESVWVCVSLCESVWVCVSLCESVWVCVSLNQPALHLFSIVLHRRPPLFHLHHQALKQPLLILQGLLDLHHPEHMRSQHQIESSLIYSWGTQSTRIKFVFPPGTRRCAGDLRGSDCTVTSQETKAYEYLMGMRQAKGSVCRYRR